MLTRKAFQYRLYPTPTQEHTLLFVLRRCRHLYNSALEQRRAFYQMRHKSLGYSAQAAELADIKAAYPAYQDIHSQVLQDALRRLDKAFAAFFRRIRNGETPGYPRFQGEGRYDSFTYPQSGFAVADTRGPGQNRYAVLILSKIGNLKVRLHRPLVGQVKTCTIKRDVNHWYVTFSCEVEEEPLPPCAEAVGLDLGVLHFATLSTGETTRNPRPYRRGLKRIKLLRTAQGPQKAGLPSAQTRGDCPGQSASAGAQPTKGLPAPSRPCPGQALWNPGLGRPKDHEHDQGARTQARP